MGSIFLRFPVFPTSEINPEKIRGWIVGADDWTEGWEEGSFQSSSVDERKNNHLLFVERVDRAVRRGLGSSSQSSTTITKTITIPTGRGSTGMSRRSWLHIRRTTPIIPIVHGYNNEEVFWKYVQAVDLVDFFDVSDLGVASQSLSQSSSTTIRQKRKLRLLFMEFCAGRDGSAFLVPKKSSSSDQLSATRLSKWQIRKMTNFSYWCFHQTNHPSKSRTLS